MLSESTKNAESWGLWVFLNDGNGNLTVATKGNVAGTEVEGGLPIKLLTGVSPSFPAIAVGDVNGDGAPDIAAIEQKNAGTSNVYLLLTEP